jgi:hypothetical protein
LQPTRTNVADFAAVDRSIPGIYIGIGDRFSDFVDEEAFCSNRSALGGLTLGRHTRFSPGMEAERGLARLKNRPGIFDQLLFDRPQALQVEVINWASTQDS